VIKDRIQEEINKQINEEMFSAYLYLAMSADFAAKNLPGFANWMHIQYQEEMSHTMKFYNYLIERGGEVELRAIEKPQKNWETPLVAFEAAYAHEQHITGRINEMMDAAIEERDHATQIMLQWFVTEQVEEEANADEIVNKLKFIEGNKHAIYMLDREMAQRVFTDETAK